MPPNGLTMQEEVAYREATAMLHHHHAADLSAGSLCRLIHVDFGICGVFSTLLKIFGEPFGVSVSCRWVWVQREWASMRSCK